MVHHRVYVYASDQDSIRAAAADAGAIGYECFGLPGAFVGYIDVPSLAMRGSLRSDARVGVLPNRHSLGNDVSKHAQALGVKNAKTARDIFSAVFASTGLDLFDPDL